MTSNVPTLPRGFVTRFQAQAASESPAVSEADLSAAKDLAIAEHAAAGGNLAGGYRMEVLRCEIVFSYIPGNDGDSPSGNDLYGSIVYALNHDVWKLFASDPDDKNTPPFTGPPYGVLSLNHKLRADGKYDANISMRNFNYPKNAMFAVKKLVESKAGQTLEGVNAAKVVLHEVKCCDVVFER